MPDVTIISSYATYDIDLDTDTNVYNPEHFADGVRPDFATVTVKGPAIRSITFKGRRVMDDGTPARDRDSITISGPNLRMSGPAGDLVAAIAAAVEAYRR